MDGGLTAAILLSPPLHLRTNRFFVQTMGSTSITILQSLVAGLAGLGIPFLCTETHELGEEVVASYLYQVSLYHWLEQNGFDRFLVDGDL